MKLNPSRLIAVATLSLASLASAIPVITEIAVTPGPTSGGNRVYIEGLGLSTVTSVTFGAIAVTPDLATSNYIICNAPAGQGANISVQAFGGGTSNVVSTFSYAPPVVTNLSASSSPTSGGSVLTITGANFGFSRTVTIGGVFATPTGVNNHTQLQVVIPPGQGINQPVVVSVAGQTNRPTPAAQLSYIAPSIDNIVSNGFTTAGGTATINGTNFGLTPQVLVNGVATTNSGGNTHTSITFNVPPGSGTNIPVQVVVAGQTSNTVALSYPAPTLSGLTSPTRSTAGGYEITLTGQNLGPTSAATIVFNGQPISALPSSPGHTSLKFIAPAGNGIGRLVTVVTGGQNPQTPLFFSYDPPIINRIIPSSFQTTGGELAVIQGSNFGPFALVLVNNQTVSVSQFRDDNITITVPPSSSPGTASVQVISAGQLSNAAFTDYFCPADFNDDGSVDFFDYLDFVAAFSTPC